MVKVCLEDDIDINYLLNIEAQQLKYCKLIIKVAPDLCGKITLFFIKVRVILIFVEV